MSITRLSRKDADLVLEYRARMAVADAAIETLYQRRTEYMRQSVANGAAWGAAWGMYRAGLSAVIAALARVDALADDIHASAIPEDFDFMTGAFEVDAGIDPQGRLL